ncbi:MAG: translation initiation factor IF-2 [Clostridiales bacterium]|nr:translation initiation factor IF-2 [Clostridiales bacterium]
MSKIRVYQLAKDLNVTTKDIITKMEELNIEVNNHMSTLEDNEIATIKKMFSKSEEAPAKKKTSWTVGTPKVNRPKRKSDYQNRTNRPQGKPVQKPVTQAAPVKQEAVVQASAKPAVHNKPVHNKPVQNKPVQSKPAEVKIDPKTNKPFDYRSNVQDPNAKTSNRPASNKPASARPASTRPASTRPESKPAPVISSASKPTTAPIIGDKKSSKKKKKKHMKPEYNTNASLEDKFSKKIKKKSRKRDIKGFDNSEFFDAEGNLMVPEMVTVGKFADMLGESSADVIMKLMAAGIMANLNQEIPFETAELIAMEFEVPCKVLVPVDEAEIIVEKYFVESEDENMISRPPVVTVMGHVDHGKTSLLDAIRETAVTDKEAGGITQHIGASEAIINNQRIVFLDTPGHEAFTTLRARGAQVTDIAVLVVAADDGVMPQTIEAIDHAKAAGVPIIVAINKIDKVGNNPDQVKSELSDHGLLVEDWGGDVISVEVSALKKINIEGLLEMILLQSEVLELKANPEKAATGTIIDAKVDKGRGVVATLLVQNGTLEIGNSIVCGSAYGRVRAMYNHLGKRTKTAGPSTGVEITGLSEIPVAGDRFFVAEDDRIARKIAEKKSVSERNVALKDTPQHVTLEDIFDRIQAGKTKEIKIVLKADVQGSLEALKTSLLRLTTEEVTVNVIHSSVGTITENDVLLASASDAIIIGFNVRPSIMVENLSQREGVELKTYRIIYEAINDVSDALLGMLDPEYKEEVLGTIEVRQLIKVPNIGTIAGGYVVSGRITRSAEFRLIREGIVVHEGKIASLRRFKDDVKEVAKGYECGIGFENYNDMKENDIIEAFHMVEIKRKNK